FANARPAVGKLHRNLLSVALGAHPQSSAASLFQRIQSVFHQLDEYLKELVTVAPNFRQARLDGSLNANFLIVQLQLSHLHAALQEHRQIDHRLLPRTLLREAEKIRDQI